MSPSSLDHRLYTRSECVVFRKTKERFGGLSNMAAGFPIRLNGVEIGTSEALYQAFRFPHRPDVQSLILSERSPMTAKMRSKPFRQDSRADWDQVRVAVMRWCLRAKLSQNWSKFRDLLLETGDRPIVEDSHKDDFWGAVPVEKSDILKGTNVLGRLLMELREKLKSVPEEELKHLPPPQIPGVLLCGRPIMSEDEPTHYTVHGLTYTLEESQISPTDLEQGHTPAEDDVQGLLFDVSHGLSRSSSPLIREETRKSQGTRSTRKRRKMG